jgi:hypothetical protein
MQEPPGFDANIAPQAALSIRVWYDMFGPGIGVFLTDGSVQPGTTVTDLEAAFPARTKTLKRDKVPEDRLERAKTRLSNLEAARLQLPFEHAKRIGLIATSGDVRGSSA